MKRRDFLQSPIALASAPETGPFLEAIAAEELPYKTAVPEGARGPFVEIRTYAANPPDRGSLEAAGFDCVFLDSLTLLANFESLEERISAWSKIGQPQEVTSVSVFRLVNC